MQSLDSQRNEIVTPLRRTIMQETVYQDFSQIPYKLEFKLPCTVINDRKKQSASYLLNRHLFSAVAEKLTCDEAASVFFSAGLAAGEEDALNHFNLEDVPEEFIYKFLDFHSRTNLQSWSSCTVEPGMRSLEMEFSVLEACGRWSTKKWFLECRFLQGYLKGMLECYTNTGYEVNACCGKKCFKLDQGCFKTCCYKIVAIN